MKNFRRKYFFEKISDQLFEIFGTDHQALKLIFFGDGHEHQPASLWGPNSTSHAVREISHILLNNNTVARVPVPGLLKSLGNPRMGHAIKPIYFVFESWNLVFG